MFRKESAGDAAAAAKKTAENVQAATADKLGDAKKAAENLKQKASDGLDNL